MNQADRSHSATWVVYAAILGNAAVAACKFIAAALTGSSAMLSEGIHSSVDTGNGLLLLLGRHRSHKPSDGAHPFGHGRELYFWSLVVALIIFGVGGGVSVYEGILHIQHPPEPKSPTWNYVVLALALVFEGMSWTIAARAFLRRLRPGESTWELIHRSKDPSIFMVLLEDSAALLGLIVAFAGIYVGRLLDRPYLDGVASIIIGLILGVVASILAYETHDLIVGEGADHRVVQSIKKFVGSDHAVERANTPLTMQLAPHDVLVNLDVQFHRGLSIRELEAAVERLERGIRERHPEVGRIFIEARGLWGHADEVAVLEQSSPDGAEHPVETTPPP